MAITQEGEFFFEDRNLYGGIRQDLPANKRRYRILKNFHFVKKDSPTKRKGTKSIGAAVSGTPELRAGIDAHFASGTQKLVMAAGSDAYVYNTTTFSWDAQSLSLTSGDTTMMMFANNVLLANGTEFKDYDGSTWGNVSGSPPIGHILTSHANRAIVSGRSAAPYEFYYSGVRNYDSWDVTNDKVIVGGLSGEVLTGAGTLGRWLFIGSEFNTWVYLQSATNPGDWDFVNLSQTVGPSSHKSVFEVTHKHVRMVLFWSPDGPMVAFQIGNNLGLKPLWQPIYKMVDGVSDKPLTGVNTERFNQISGEYNPELNEACFGVPNTDGTENNMLICYEIDGLLAYVTGEIDQPVVNVKDNGNSGVFPCDILMQVRVTDATDVPATTGRNRFFGGRQGELFRIEAANTYKDSGNVPISMWMKRSGYSGEGDGAAGFEKVAQKARIAGTQNGGYAVTMTVTADGGEESQNQQLSLDGGLGLWKDGGLWTTDPAKGKWNQATTKRARGDFGVHGTNFSIEVTDYGSINGAFEMSELSLDGFVYERQ